MGGRRAGVSTEVPTSCRGSNTGEHTTRTHRRSRIGVSPASTSTPSTGEVDRQVRYGVGFRYRVGVTDAYFKTDDGVWFRPSDYCRGPWDPRACHAGPPMALMVRAIEGIGSSHRLARLTVELARPIPMAGFRVEATIRNQGRSVTTSQADILDDEKVYARAFAMHLRTREHLDCTTAPVDAPDLARSIPGPFPITETRHGLSAFPDSLEVRYDPGREGGPGGPTTLWMKALPILADEEPSGFQRICPLADSGNGISFNDYLDRVLFVNPELTLSLHREPVGEWFCSRAVSHWEPDGVGLADAELFDTTGHVGRALQSLLLDPA